MTFTLVTGLWDIKRGDLTEFGRSFDHYLENFDRLLSLDFNMAIYVPAELKQYVLKRRTHRNTRVYVQELSDFERSFEFYKDVQCIRIKEDWYKKAAWLENSPQAKLTHYNPIVMSKFFMLNDVAIYDPFNTQYHFWIDAGLTNTVDVNLLSNLSHIKNYMKSVNDKFLFLSFPYENNNEVHGFDSNAFAEFCDVDKTEYVCRGGFFGGTKEKIHRMNGIYYGLLKDTLDKGVMGTEENIHTIMAYNYASSINRFELDESGLVYPFFDNLGKIKSDIVTHNSDLIAWEKNKPIEEIKTSLYVLTFNSPRQFEALVKSYNKNDRDFLNRTRKILIDNSTDTKTYKVYNQLCKQYDFEHIKKENNIGICGARQFVAEHFNESDSEYYVFLEDDMTLNDSTDELCVSGYRRYVDSLFMKSLAIVHKNKYDYLKLSFSEFYGTNKTQWAWYNVPQDVRTEYFPDRPNLPEAGLDPDPPQTSILQEKRYKDLKYFEGEFHYCNWPLFFSRTGNRKVFLDTKWNNPYEQTWMSNVFQLQKIGKIKCATLALSPIFHHRFEFYDDDERKES
jgi:hypothetical protein